MLVSLRVSIHGNSACATLLSRLQELSSWSLQPIGFGDLSLNCAILKRVPNGTLITVDGDTCILALSAQRSRFPYRRYSSLKSPLALSNGLVLRKDTGAFGLKVLLRELDRPLVLSAVAADSDVFRALSESTKNFAVLTQWQRAALRTTGSFEQWMSENFDQKRRKELKRLRKRFSEQGTLVTERLGDVSELPSYIDDFLTLEDGGWKGARGSSLRREAGMEAVMREGLVALQDAKKLLFWRLKFDGVAIASLFAVVDNGQVTLGKIAYREDFSKYSPGVLLILDATEDFFANPDIEMADSNAIPNHPMIDRIWRDRLSYADVLIAPDAMSAAAFALCRKLETGQRKIRSIAKSTYYSFKGENPS
jgi:hypothetical protein